MPHTRAPGSPPRRTAYTRFNFLNLVKYDNFGLYIAPVRFTNRRVEEAVLVKFPGARMGRSRLVLGPVVLTWLNGTLQYYLLTYGLVVLVSFLSCS